MSKEIRIIEYDKIYEEKWDKFVLNECANGTFLQTRNFLSYHPQGKFKDSSLLFMNGNTIVAVLPAHIERKKNIARLLSHQGSTFGGIVIGKNYCNVSYVELILNCLEKYINEKDFHEVVLKQTSSLYQKNDSNLIDYFLYINGFECSQELGYYIDFDDYNKDIVSNFSSSRRRDYRYSLKNNFIFRQLQTVNDIQEFYEILCNNYMKFQKKPVHAFEELLDFKYSRIPQNIDFYGVYFGDKMIAGGMVFLFANEIMHTQYLAVKQEYTNLFVNEFLYTNIIEAAWQNHYKKLSFGTSTLEEGRVLNRNLALYKEGFGTKEYINFRYKKRLSDK